jgi:hypothetical protein
MSNCGGDIHSLTSSAGCSETTATRAGTALFLSKGEPTENAPLRFSSYAEKYAYYRGKAHCIPISSYPCNLKDSKTYTE